MEAGEESEEEIEEIEAEMEVEMEAEIEEEMELGKETEMGDDDAASGWGESEEAEAGQRAPTATPTAAAVIAAAASFPPAAILPRQGARTRQQPRCLTLTASL